MITQEEMQNNWKAIAGAVRNEFGQITGADLSRVEGSIEQLVGLIQSKTGKTKEQVKQFLDSCAKSTSSTVNRFSDAAAEYASYAGEAVRENYDRVAESAHAGYRQTMRTVSRRPLESMALAVGAGLLAGVIVGISMTGRRR
ncbi:MAG: CsbD family protein [Pirellulaceae bacterium]